MQDEVEITSDRRRSASAPITLCALAVIAFFGLRATHTAAAQPGSGSRAAPTTVRRESRMRGAFAGLSWHANPNRASDASASLVGPLMPLPLVEPTFGAAAEVVPGSRTAAGHDSAFGVLGIDTR